MVLLTYCTSNPESIRRLLIFNREVLLNFKKQIMHKILAETVSASQRGKLKNSSRAPNYH